MAKKSKDSKAPNVTQEESKEMTTAHEIEKSAVHQNGHATEAPAVENVSVEKVTKETEIEKVLMTDGRTVEFSGSLGSKRARKILKETILEDDRVGIRMDFRNGETRTYWCPQGMVLRFAGHGMEQKYGDEAAGENDIDDIVIAMDEMNERVQNGEWYVRREGGGFAGTSILLKALVEISGKSVDEIKSFLKGKSQGEKLTLRNSPKVKPVVERLESEKLAKSAKIDTDVLLAEIGV